MRVPTSAKGQKQKAREQQHMTLKKRNTRVNHQGSGTEERLDGVKRDDESSDIEAMHGIEAEQS